MRDTLGLVITPQVGAMAWSFVRVFLAAALGVFLTLGRLPLDLTRGDLKAITNAGLAALLLLVYNYVRSGDSRFGHSYAQEPVLPDEPDPEVLEVPEVPEQTDNRPRPEDGTQMLRADALGEIEWSGKEMR